MSFLNRLFGKKSDREKAAPPARPRVMSVSTTFPNQLTAEQMLATSGNPDARLDAVTALGKMNSQLVVPALAKALAGDQDQYVRAAAAGYLGSIKGIEAERALLQAAADPDPYVRKRVVESLFRVGTERARKAVDAALQDADPKVRAEAEKCAARSTRKVAKRLCPFLTESGMCEPPGVSDAHECSWEVLGRGHYNGCFVYKMHTHPGGPADYLRRHLAGRL